MWMCPSVARFCRQAASSLQTKLVRGDASAPKASPQMLQALVCGPLLVPLVGMLGDTVEKCRWGAAAAAAGCLHVGGQVGGGCGGGAWVRAGVCA